MARPQKPVDWKDVDKLCAIQCTQEEIASFFDICLDTLQTASKRENGISFSEYYNQKRKTGRISLRRAQWQKAISGNPTMLIWLGKQYLEQNDKQVTTLETTQDSKLVINMGVAAAMADKPPEE